MRSGRALLGIVCCAFAGGSATASSISEDCAPVADLLRQARTDFPSLRQKKMDPGKCSFRQSEYRCAWHFPGDAFDASDAQTTKLVECVAANAAAQRTKIKGRDAAFSVDPDLTVLIPAPQLDGDGWNVLLTIRSSYKPQ